MPIVQLCRCYTTQALVSCVTRALSETLSNFHGLTRVARDLIPRYSSRWTDGIRLGQPPLSYWPRMGFLNPTDKKHLMEPTPQDLDRRLLRARLCCAQKRLLKQEAVIAVPSHLEVSVLLIWR